MLRYLMRTLPVVVRARAGQDGRLVSRLDRRVGLDQVDLNRHMNQAAYFQVMELGRIDWLLRSGAWDRWRAQGTHFVVAEQHIVYRRELKPLARYVLDTRAVSVEGRLLSFTHHLLLGETVAARGTAKFIFVGAHGVLPPEAVEPLGEGLLAPELSVVDWRVV